MSLSSKSQEKHGYSKTLTEYKSEKIQEEKAKIAEVLIDKDGYFYHPHPPPERLASGDCYIDRDPLTVSLGSQILHQDFRRCDYDSFSKRISNCWLLKTILSSRSQ